MPGWGRGQQRESSLEGDERRGSVCILRKTISYTEYSTHKGFVTRASWVSWKSKEARVAGKRRRRKQQWGMR